MIIVTIHGSHSSFGRSPIVQTSSLTDIILTSNQVEGKKVFVTLDEVEMDVKKTKGPKQIATPRYNPKFVKKTSKRQEINRQ